jgi:hypothetical protein
VGRKTVNKQTNKPKKNPNKQRNISDEKKLIKFSGSFGGFYVA